MLTEQQLQERKTGIGGSDAAAVCGISKYKTPVQVYLDKLGLSHGVEENEAMYWGNVLEPIVRDEYIRRSGEKVTTTDIIKRHSEHNFMLANVDGIIGNGKAIFEAKICSSYNMIEWGEPGTDEMPQSYLMQCAHYAAVYDVAYVDLGVLFGNRWHFEIYRYHRNKQLEKNLIEIERDFWNNHVLKEIPPEPINSGDVVLLYPSDNGGIADADDEICGHLLEYQALKEKIREYEKQADYFKTQVISHMKEASSLLNSGVLLATYKQQTSSRFDNKKFEKIHPDLYPVFLKQSSSRVLKIKGGNL